MHLHCRQQKIVVNILIYGVHRIQTKVVEDNVTRELRQPVDISQTSSKVSRAFSTYCNIF